MGIEKTVQAYRDRVQDFKNTFDTKMTLEDVDRYCEDYRKQIQSIDQLNWQQKELIFEAIGKVINSEIIPEKRSLSWHTTNWRTLEYEKSAFIKAVTEKAEGLENEIDLNHIANIVFIADPWRSHPEKDDEFEIHRKWWLDVELKKHEIVLKNTDERVKHGEKTEIRDYFEANKSEYLTDKFKFKDSSKGYNRSKIYRGVKKKGGFSSSTSNIRDFIDDMIPD